MNNITEEQCKFERCLKNVCSQVYMPLHVVIRVGHWSQNYVCFSAYIFLVSLPPYTITMQSHFLLPWIPGAVSHPCEVQCHCIFHPFPLFPFKSFQLSKDPITETLFLGK